MFSSAVAAVGLLLGQMSAPEVLASGLAPKDVLGRPYVDYAKQCIDLLIEHGTDRYGPVHAPILVNILDLRTRTCPENPLPLDEAWRVTRRERRGPAGVNLYPDQSTMRAIFALTEATGEERYARFARESLGYYLKNLADDRGFFWWGWHRHYDVYRDTMTGHAGNHHEIHIQQILWPELWSVTPDAVTREIEAIWQWHVVDKTTGEVNRHGDGCRGCDFAMSGGEVLRSFAFLYEKTGDKAWLDRARLVADYYWNARNPDTNLIPNRPNAGRERFDGSHFDTSITAFLCRSLLDAFERTGDASFRDMAAAYLRAYARHGYDPEAGEFWGSLTLDGAPVPGPRVAGGYAQYEPRGHVDLWQPYAAGYEHPIYTAQAYAYAYEVTGEKDMLEAAKRWANAIRRSFPPGKTEENTWYAEYSKQWAPHGTYAGKYGRTISFFLHLAHLTGDATFGRFAREVANEAIARLYYNGLFRGHSAKPYYESIDGVGFLLHAIIQLDRPRGPRETAGFRNW